MNVLAILLPSLLLFFIAYKFYGRHIERIFDVDGTHPTPAAEVNDGVDYVPTRKFVLFGHHFASIAGGGPIIGPTVALIFGYLPVWLWVVIGSILIGGVHDLCALIASIREKGRSMAEIAQGTFGRTGFFLFLGFTMIMLLMVTSVFLVLTSTALSSRYPASFFGDDLGTLRTMVENGTTYVVIGGIASTSVIIITLFAPLVGFLLYKKGVSSLQAAAMAITVCMVSIWIGSYHPLSISPLLWMVIISIYTVFAAGVPVWLVLQPRDFTNSFLLYAGIAIMFVCVLMAGFGGEKISAPALNIAAGSEKLGALWPILFITVACGAISGFHSLVAGGTSSKQLAKERPDARVIGYGGMFVEALLAILVFIALSVGISFDQYLSMVFPSDPLVRSNPILAFALGMGGLLNKATGTPVVYGTVFGILMVEGFVVTTLDTAVRLNRYLLEELWKAIFKKAPRLLSTYIFNASLCVILMFLLAYFNAFKQLWVLFGSANQLLAALTLIVVSAWLIMRGKRYLFALIPGTFMLITTFAALLSILINDYIPNGNWTLAAGDAALMILALATIGLMIKMIKERRGQQKPSAAA